jgi:hypothetical protein
MLPIGCSSQLAAALDAILAPRLLLFDEGNIVATYKICNIFCTIFV